MKIAINHNHQENA